MNLLIPSIKEKNMQIYTENEWKSVNRKEQMRNIFDNQWNYFDTWNRNNNDNLTNRSKKMYCQMEKKISNEDNYKEIQCKMVNKLYNNRKIIIKNKKECSKIS